MGRINFKDARLRVGGTGKRRTELPCFFQFKKLAPVDVVNRILKTAAVYPGDDIGGDNYKISHRPGLVEKVSAGYRQVLLQHCVKNKDPLVEQNYTVWQYFFPTTCPIRKWLGKEFPGAYRARVAIMPPNGQIDWHTDTDTSVSCRIHVCAHANMFKFEIRTKTETHSRIFLPGDVVFTNVGWAHKVTNNGKQNRINLIFGIDYEDLVRGQEEFKTAN